MTGITPETQLYEEIPRALLCVQEKYLAKKKSRKMDEEILRLLSDLSNMLDLRGDDDEKDEIEDSGDTNEGTMVKSDNEHAGPMAKMTAADEEMADEAEDFAEYRTDWEYAWSKTCGSFEHMTALSSMQFTYYTPGRRPANNVATTHPTLQIYSIKLAEIAGGLEWPLSVYGVVAVRDPVDHNRNFLFYCDRKRSQELTKNDPFLRLIGPSRAVVYTYEVNFEMELKVKGATESQDKALISEGRNRLEVFGHEDVSTVCFENCFCTMELCAQIVEKTTQATILGVQVEAGQWPFTYGARVACSSLAGEVVVTEDNRVTFVTSPSCGEIVMLDSKDGGKLKGGGGYLHLPRSVISVEDQGSLDVDIQAYSKSGVIAARCHVRFPAKFSKITRKSCYLGGVKLVVTIAWSLVARDKSDIMALGCLV